MFPRRRCCAPCPGYQSAPVCSPGKRSATGETCRHGCRTTETQKAHPAGWACYLFDAWQFMAGVLPATLRAVAAQRSNPLPADLSCSGERSPTDNRQNKRPSLSTEPFVLFDAWQFPTLTWGDPTLPSALRRFTSEFGMGSGGTTALSPPGKFCFQHVLRTHRVICITLKIFSQIRQNSFGVVRLSLTVH